METILKYFMSLLTMFGCGTVYFLVFLFWSAVISYFIRKCGYIIITVEDKNDKSNKEEKT